jgi:predicted nucleotidyltransferase
MKQAVKTILAELKRRLEDLYGERLVRVILYGSQARGDASDGSDIDVLIVLRGETSPCEEIARTAELAAELSLRHNVAIVPAFASESRYEGEQSPLLLNVRREGVPV